MLTCKMMFNVCFALMAVEPAPDSAKAKSGLTRNEPGAFQGYTLFAPLRSGKTYLIDMAGNVVHTWKSKYSPGNAVYLLDNGHLLRTASDPKDRSFFGGGIGGRIEEFDWD